MSTEPTPKAGEREHALERINGRRARRGVVRLRHRH
jgi:hypothetical protein